MFASCLPIALIVVALLFQLAASGMGMEHHKPQQETPLSLSLSECAAKHGECDDSEGPVCGTDSRTYPTRCHLLRVQCSGHQVSLKHRGNCKSCLIARQYAHRERERNSKIFIPRCRSDGNYAAVQCLGNTGCWCSDSSGNPIENTSTRRRKPKCGRNNRRRSSPRDMDSAEGGHRGCSKTDRMTFNTHVTQVFRNEHTRQRQPPAGLSDLAVLEWKFSQLDVNHDQLLDRQEVRELKRILKRAVKPRRCGRAFGKYCDVNKDDSLSQAEWSTCLSKDASYRKTTFNALSGSSASSSTTLTTIPRRIQYTNLHTIQQTLPNHDHTNTNTIGTSSSSGSSSSSSTSTSISSNMPSYHDNESEEFEEEFIGEEEDEGMQHSHPLPLSPTSFNFLNAKTAESTINESEGEANCWTDREMGREEQRHNGNMTFYVPECMADGRYKRVQCYSSVCWCVNEETGQGISGTFGPERPQCDEVTAERPMKGCTEPRKTQFLKELKEFLNTQILPSISTGNSTRWKSEDERIATLSFVFLDKNKSKLWERKEWKGFRDLVTSTSNLSKCGKKMPRYCDVNGDKKISLSEWVNCLQAQRIVVTTTAKPANSNEMVTARFKGSNPLEIYLT